METTKGEIIKNTNEGQILLDFDILGDLEDSFNGKSLSDKAILLDLMDFLDEEKMLSMEGKRLLVRVPRGGIEFEVTKVKETTLVLRYKSFKFEMPKYSVEAWQVYGVTQGA